MTAHKPIANCRGSTPPAARAGSDLARLFGLLGTLDYSRITGGAFGMTYASVGFMYDFRADRNPASADPQAAGGELSTGARRALTVR
jgi:hypothetical protein